MPGVVYRAVTIEPAVDSIAPILTSPTATATGQTTATGTVTTDEANGTLYYYMSTNATELAATVIASGSSQAVTQSGSPQSVSFSGLTAGTAYYAHYVHRDAAANDSGRVSSAQITTSAATGGSVYRAVTITPAAETIVSISGSTAGSTITVTTGGLRNLNTYAPTLTYGGIACTSITVTSASTFTAVMPSAGLALGSSNNFVMTVMGVQSAPAARAFDAALGQHATLTVAYAAFSPDSWARDDELDGITNSLVIGDQVECALKTNGTTSTPAGYDVNVDGLGNIWLTDPTGSEGNLDAETELVSVDVALIDASDTHARSNVMTINLALNMPTGTLTLGTPVVSNTTATLPFAWTGVNATGFEYQLGSGTITAIGASPIALTGLTAATLYTYRVRAANGVWPGSWHEGTFTTAESNDLTPDPFTFTNQTGAQINTRVWSNWQPVTGVSAGQNIALTVSGDTPEWQYSTDGGTTASAATSSAGTVRLNYLVRVSVLTSADYSTDEIDEIAVATVTCGGVESYFQVTSRYDDVVPVITLTGGNMTVTQGGVFTEPGYTATDAYDGTLTGSVVVTGSVNTAALGSYTLTYTVSDAQGNVGTTTRVVTVVSAGTGLQVDTVPASITRFGAFNLVVSGAVEAPTLQNTVCRVNGAQGPALNTTAVTGSGPWTITFLARFELPIQFSEVGYPLHLTVGSETAVTAQIPMLPGVLPFINLLTVATGPGTIHDIFPQWTLGVGDQIVYQSATRNAGVPVSISSSGVPSLLGPLLVADSIIYRVIKADGTVSTVPPNLEITFDADSDVEHIRDVVPRLLATDANLVRVFLGRDNIVRVRITHDGTTINMEQFSRFVLSGFPDDIDSDDNPEVFDVTEGNGVLDLMLGQLLTSPGVYKLRLVGYSQLQTNGVVLFDQSLVDASVTAIVMNA